MKLKFSEIVDISKLRILLEGLYSSSGIRSSLVDTEGNILVVVGWQEICLNYHRANSETELLCKQSDMLIAESIKDTPHFIEPYICYTCANGLEHAAAPIIIEGEHLATIILGQFFFEKPYIAKFRKHAKRYGFNEAEYIKTLAKVPIYSRDKLDSSMLFFRQLAEILAEMGLARVMLIESKEKALHASEQRLKTIINNTPNVAIQSYDLAGKIQFSNKASETIFGWTTDEAVGKTLDKLIFDQETAEQFLELIKTADRTNNALEPMEWTFKNKSGLEKSVYSTVFPINLPEGQREFICIDIDITEKKRLETEMHRLRQLNLIGEMAAGIAHEVRNPMTTVRGFLQILGNKNYNQQDKEYFKLMIQELDRANSIITEFLALAKNDKITLKRKNLNTVISVLTPLVEAILREVDQDLKLDLREIPELLLDEKEIRQLILNLAKNGIEAMQPGGCLTIKTYQQNEEVVLEVTDEGEGIRQDIMDKIGTPFFSTKEKGTGLGLAVCYRIVAEHNAKISVASNSCGTTFSIHFNL